MILTAIFATVWVALLGFVAGILFARRRYRRQLSQLSQQNNRREDGLCAVIENLRRENDLRGFNHQDTKTLRGLGSGVTEVANG